MFGYNVNTTPARITFNGAIPDANHSLIGGSNINPEIALGTGYGFGVSGSDVFHIRTLEICPDSSDPSAVLMWTDGNGVLTQQQAANTSVHTIYVDGNDVDATVIDVRNYRNNHHQFYINTDGSVWHRGGAGLFGTNPPAAPSAITGVLSAVTDANAKAVLTSIIAALIADGGATNTTT